MASPLGLDFNNINNQRAIPQYRVVDNKAVKSLFSDAQFSPYPTVVNKESGSVDGINNAFEIHNDAINDLSVQSIIEYTSQYESMKLNYAHFAYLKNLGVYPNNRLIIARRFAAGVANDLTEVKGTPLSTLISWFNDTDDTFSIKFNEEWEQAEGGFEDVLNDIGEDVLMGDNKGGKLGGANKGAFGIIPLPGIMEGVQLELFKKLGIAGEDQGSGRSPFGNPNLIRDAQQRKVLKKATAGSGLTCDFEVKMTIEYEQKFINGVDPTLVYMDILQNALTFGTSESVFQYSSAFAAGATGIIKKLISGDINAIIQALEEMIKSLIEVIKDQIIKVVDGLKKAITDKKSDKNKTDEQKQSERDDAELSAIDKASDFFLGNLNKALKISLGTVLSKYKVRLLGIVNALTGSPSAPWHVTIGNPKKPIFSSGDLICTGVNVTLGKVLAFNDLPSSIKLDVTFKPARDLGAQEIFNRFNTGRGRSYTRVNKSFIEVNEAIVDEKAKKEIVQENQNKNAETQDVNKKTDNPATTPVNKDTQNDTSTTQKPDNKGTSQTDSYIVDFSKKGVEWGSKQSQIPQENTSKVGDSTTAETTNDPSTKLSNQSVSDPNVKPEVKSSDSSATNRPNATTPGVTQSNSEIQSQVAQGNTEAEPPQPESLPAPEPPEREPELVFDENGNLVSERDLSTIETTVSQEVIDEYNGLTDEQMLVAIDILNRSIESVEKDINEIESFLRLNPNFSTEDPEEYENLVSELEDYKKYLPNANKQYNEALSEYKRRKSN